ncbi:hypothetical protein BDR26DRAFT_853654 [Obelidium mucronatum]|nr:hypothetical protein BDR26DRAFT_853654 [Obelidium mucronatum]
MREIETAATAAGVSSVANVTTSMAGASVSVVVVVVVVVVGRFLTRPVWDGVSLSFVLSDAVLLPANTPTPTPPTPPTPCETSCLPFVHALHLLHCVKQCGFGLNENPSFTGASPSEDCDGKVAELEAAAAVEEEEEDAAKGAGSLPWTHDDPKHALH